MAKARRKEPDPQPSNFDAELGRPRVDMHEGHRRKAVVLVLVTVEGDAASGSSASPSGAVSSPARSSPSSCAALGSP
jgi:hypothetical protein